MDHLNHAVRGVEGIASNDKAIAPDPLDALSPVAALFTAHDRSGGGCEAIAVAACILDVFGVASLDDVESLLEAVLRGAVRTVLVSHPPSLGDADVSACDTFHALSALGVRVYAADRGWLNPDDFGVAIPNRPRPAPVSPSDACVSPSEDRS